METHQVLDQIVKKLESIEHRLDTIEQIVNQNAESAANMDRHIGFVESVYEQIRTPFNKLIAYTSNPLPLLFN